MKKAKTAMTKTKSGSKDATGGDAPSKLIGARIKELADWRGDALSRIRRLIHEADPDAVEEVKWRKPSNPAGVPVWSHDGIICTGETYKDKVKLTFAKGASLADPAGLQLHPLVRVGHIQSDAVGIVVVLRNSILRARRL